MYQQTPSLTQLVCLTASGILTTVLGVFPIQALVAAPPLPSRQPRSNLVASGDGKEGEESHENTFLDDSTCVTRGKEVDRTTSEVVVGKQLYTSIMQMSPGVKITCRLRKTGSTPKFQSLSLLFGLDDDSKFTGARIIVYKDGEKATSNISSHGEVNKLVVNVKDAHSITLEINCPPDISQCKPPEDLDESEQVKYTVHFFQATLDPIRASVTPQPPPHPRRSLQPSKPASITQKQAVDLIKAWLQAKKKIFAPPYDRQLVAKITTGELYKKTTGADGYINRLKQHNAYYRYGVQKIEKVDQFIANGDRAIIQVKVTEEIKYYRNGNLERENSSFKTQTVLYNLESVGGRWKIADGKTIE